MKKIKQRQIEDKKTIKICNYRQNTVVDSQLFELCFTMK